MNDEAIRLIIIIVGWLTTGGGIAIITNVWVQKKKEPIDKITAMIANATSANNSAVANANEVTKVTLDMYKMLDIRLSAVEKQNEEKGLMLTKLTNEFFQFRSFVKYWYQDLVTNWEDHRRLDTPPPMEFKKEEN